MSQFVGLGDVAYVLRRVLPSRWLFALARWYGNVMYAVRPAGRRALIENLAPFATDRRQAKVMARRFLQNRYVRVMMLFLFLGSNDDRRREMVEIEGIEHLDRALTDGRGAVLLGSHLNSLGVFMSLIVLRQSGYDVRVALPSDAELFPVTRVGRILRRGAHRPSLSEELGGFYVRFNVRPIVRALAENAVIGQTGDGWHSAAFAVVPFLGGSFPFTTGMMSIAQNTGAAVVPFNVVGTPPNLRCVISPAFHVEQSEHPAEGVERAVARYVDGFERDLRANLLCWEHWLVPNTLETMQTWPQRPLHERLEV